MNSKISLVYVLQIHVMEAFISKLKPTQLCIGSYQVEEFKNILSKISKDEIIIPCIKGINNDLYITSCHHLVRALYDMQIEKVKVKIIHDFSSLIEKEFWKKMSQENHLWLYDENGMPLYLETFIKLRPYNINDMKDDPYLSLIGMILKKELKVCNNMPRFFTYNWSNYLRKHIKIKGTIREKNIKKAILLSKDFFQYSSDHS